MAINLPLKTIKIVSILLLSAEIPDHSTELNFKWLVSRLFVICPCSRFLDLPPLRKSCDEKDLDSVC